MKPAIALRRGDAVPSGVTTLALRAEDWLFARDAEGLAALRRNHAIELRSAVCDLASCEPLDFGAIEALAELARDVQATRVLEELGLSTFDDRRFALALAVPHCDEVVALVAARARLVRGMLPAPLELQCLPAPPSDPGSLGAEDFAAALASASGCAVHSGPSGRGRAAAMPSESACRRELPERFAALRDELWAEPARPEWRAQIAETRRRLADVFGAQLAATFAPECLEARIAGFLREMGPRGLDPLEWAERFLAHALLVDPAAAARLAPLEQLLRPATSTTRDSAAGGFAEGLA